MSSAARLLDPYRAHSSLLHRLDARVKLALAVGFIFTTALIPPGGWPAFILLLTITTSGVLLSRLGLGYVLKRSLLALPFILSAVPLLFTSTGEAWISFPVPGTTAVISQAGVVRVTSIALKSWLSVQAAVLLAATTPIQDLLIALRSYHLPRLLAVTIALMWRYLFVMTDEALRLLRARTARSTRVPGQRAGGRLVWRARITGGMAGSLLLRSFERSEAIYHAMVSRGYDGEIRALPSAPLSATAIFATIASAFVLGGILMLGLLTGG
ncbi:MAG TPA: cobalt ECF transporter T component CbiQ [Anaerolineaceae bacterium]|jgi:cobalt/nickel transport system permease protein|nr:cobalt ECF transporter T component CbiQ [Anaerolineaceae bacterium]